MLHIHRAQRADGLVAALADLLADPLPDPFAPEVIAVPTRGMERWLTQQISARLGARPARLDGVCANVAFPSPRRLLGDAVAAASGIVPGEDPWPAERAVWPLLEVVDGALAEPWLRSLSAHLGASAETPDPHRRVRRFSSVRHLANLFDHYSLHRPEMLRAWTGGQDTDGTRRRLPPHTLWQAELWRRLRERIAQPSPAERLAGACARLRDEPGLAELPQRISLFGLTRLPAGHLQVLRALAVRRDVHLFLLHPSPSLWESIAVTINDRPPIVRRHEDITATVGANRLLASWGQDARELQLVIGAGDDQVDHLDSVAQPADTLLGRIQADVRADRWPPGAPLPGHPDLRPALDPRDQSLQIHACHGRARQVEVVRDTVLHLLAQDASLEPRDVIVMCPDIETFAPLIQATFGAGESGEPGQSGEVDERDPLPTEALHRDPLLTQARQPDLRVRLADRSLRQTNPVLGVLAQLLELGEQRLTASQLLDLADREPVRRRFRLDDDDLTRIQDWVARSGIRWGLDGPHRAPFKLGALSAGTWRAGLDRILVGVSLTEDDQRLFGGVLPLDDVESGVIDLAGRLAELVDRVRFSLDALNSPQPVDEWAAAITAAADALTATTQREAWQRLELARLLDEIVAEATIAGTVNPTQLGPGEVRALLAERLQGRPTRANFRTGHLTICTLVPMRSVPHRVICLLGLDDGAFPRKTPTDGDDLTLDDPHVGDRDPRSEDRQMLLDALLAAEDRLILTYTGNDERTNAVRPPAVPVGELLDVIDATVRVGGWPADPDDRTVRVQDNRTRRGIIVRHPLQPFDARNFARGALIRDRPWSFDRVMLGGARALGGPRAEPGPFLDRPLASVQASIVECEDLVRFAQHPVRAFLRRRLGIDVRDFSGEVEDNLRVELDGLQKWGVGQRLLEARLAGVPRRSSIRAEIARGMLPPGQLGQPVVREVLGIVEEIVAELERLAADCPPPDSVDVRVVLAGGRLLSGTIPGVSGALLRTVTYSQVAAKHRLTAWVRLLALTASDPERPFTAVTVGRAGGRARVRTARVRPAGQGAAGRRDWALGHLTTLVDLYDRGMCEPIPVYCTTSAAYAGAAAAGRDPVPAARRQWTSRWGFDGEDSEPEHQLVLGGARTLDELLAEPPRADEMGQGQGGDLTETSRLGWLARRMWAGLLGSEQLAER
ncbi:MAG: exodeoxyribonuclease V subunit gamma [Solirubrobacteraceae bacterium]